MDGMKDHPKHLLHCINIIRESNPNLCDFTILCGDETIQAHKLILTAFSQFFAAKILKDQHRVDAVDLRNLDMPSFILKGVIKFMYTGILEENIDISVAYHVASKLGITRLEEYISILVRDKKCDIFLEGRPAKIPHNLDEDAAQVYDRLFGVAPDDSVVTGVSDAPGDSVAPEDSVVVEAAKESNQLAEKCDKENNDAESDTEWDSSFLDEQSNDDANQETLVNKKPMETRSTAKAKKIDDAVDISKSQNLPSNNKPQNLPSNNKPQHLPSNNTQAGPPNKVSELNPRLETLGSKQLYGQYRLEDGIYKCPHCDFHSALYKAFYSHIRQHKEALRPYKCDQCSKAFKEIKHLKAHFRTHSNERPFVCDVCNAAFKDPKHLSRHSKLHSGDRPFPCTEPGCRLTFVDKDRLNRHVEGRHKNHRPYECEQEGCDYRAASKAALSVHQLRHTPKEERVTTVCDICGKSMTGARSITLHMLIHNGPDVKCPDCDYTSKFKGAIKSHMLRIHGKNLEGEVVMKQHMCDLCGFQAHYSNEYKLHMLKHSGERPHKCPVCDFDTNDKNTLKIHVRSHTGETPYKCDRCERGYTSQSALVRHRRTHTGDKPHKCPHCDAAYLDKKNLVAHSYKHTGVKPFQCHLCAFSCVKKYNLDMHIRQGHGEEHVTEDARKSNGKKRNRVPRNLEPQPMDATEQVEINPQYAHIQSMGDKIDMDTAVAAAAMQTMASGVFLQKNDYGAQNSNTTLQTLEHMEYSTETSVPSVEHILPSMSTGQVLMPMDGMKSVESHGSTDGGILSVAMAELGPVPDLAGYRNVYSQHNLMSQHQSNEQQPQQQQQQLQPLLTISTTTSDNVGVVVTATPVASHVNIQSINDEGLLAGAAREAGLLTGGSTQERVTTSQQQPQIQQQQQQQPQIQQQQQQPQIQQQPHIQQQQQQQQPLSAVSREAVLLSGGDTTHDAGFTDTTRSTWGTTLQNQTSFEEDRALYSTETNVGLAKSDHVLVQPSRESGLDLSVPDNYSSAPYTSTAFTSTVGLSTTSSSVSASQQAALMALRMYQQ